MDKKGEKKIKIIQGGPYIVSGNIPLEEKIIQPHSPGVVYEQGKSYPREEEYALCRCGKSRNMPFCDGHHEKVHFKGDETASRESFLQRAEILYGPELDLADDEDLCAFARFCHGKNGNSWELVLRSDDPVCRAEAIKTITECPAGRLVAFDKETGESIEPVYEPSIVILQDPSRYCSGPAWVRGGIPIESSDGTCYEIRNRVTLCRCGHSRNKPFCDAMHVSKGFLDKEEE